MHCEVQLVNHNKNMLLILKEEQKKLFRIYAYTNFFFGYICNNLLNLSFSHSHLKMNFNKQFYSQILSELDSLFRIKNIKVIVFLQNKYMNP